MTQGHDAAAADGSGGESWFSHAVYCPPTSAWEARAGATFLRRSQLPQRALAWNGDEDDDEILTPLATTRDFNFKNQGGPEFSLLRHGENADIEFRWFQIQDFVARTPTLVGGEEGYVLTRIGPDTIQTLGETDFAAGYLSQLSSFELNVRAPGQEDRIFTPFCGFRYLEINEQLSENLLVHDGPFSVIPSVRSFNSLYGFQIGSDAALWNRGGPFRLMAVGKAGIYGNHATDRYRVFFDGEEGSAANGIKNSAAFVGELGLVFGDNYSFP